LGLDNVLDYSLLLLLLLLLFLLLQQYLVVVVTTMEVTLYAVTFAGESDVEGPLQIKRTSFSVSTDGVLITKITGTRNGRIFLTGKDGQLYEVVYCNDGDSLFQFLGITRKCRKVTVNSSPLTSTFRPVLQVLGMGGPSSLIDLVVDDYRGLLYTLSSEGAVSLFDLGADGRSIRHVAETQPVPPDKKDPKNRLISLHVIPPTESRIYHLVGVTSAGFRYYFQTSTTAFGRPRHLTVAQQISRAPPDPAIWKEAGAGGQAMAQSPEWNTYKPDYTKNSQSARTDYHKAYYRHGLLLLAEGVDDRAEDLLVSFGEDTSSKEGEVVSVISGQAAGTLPAIGRVRAIAEESEVVFPANKTSVLDHFRYNLAMSATPNDQNQEHTWASRFNKMIYQSLGDLETNHFHSEFAAMLSEASKQLYNSRIFLIMSSHGLHVVTMNRPVDILWRILLEGRNDSGILNLFSETFKEENYIALLLMIACNLPWPSRAFTDGGYEGR